MEAKKNPDDVQCHEGQCKDSQLFETPKSSSQKRNQETRHSIEFGNPEEMLANKTLQTAVG